MAITFFYRCEGSNLDGSNDYSVGDTSGAINGSAAFNSDASYSGTNGIDCPSNGSYVSFSITDHDLINPQKGSFSFRFRINTWLDQGVIFYAVGSNTSNYIKVFMNSTSGIRTQFSKAGVGTTNQTLSPTLTTGVWYHYILRWNENEGWHSSAIYDADGTIRSGGYSCASSFSGPNAPIELTELRIGNGVGAGTIDFHIDHVYISKDPLEPLYDYRDNSTYATYLTNITPTEIIRYVNPHSTGGDGTTSSLSGTNAAYANLQAALNGTRGDLVTNNQKITIICATEGDPDNVLVDQNIAGWKTDTYHYVHIKPASGHEAGTEWDTSKYRYKHIGSNFGATFAESSGGIFNLLLDNVQFHFDVAIHDGAPGRGVNVLRISPFTSTTVETVSRIIIRKCNLRIDGTKAVTYDGTAFWYGIRCAPGTATAMFPVEIQIYNNIIGQFANVTGIPTTTPTAIYVDFRTCRVHVYNNTAVGSWRNFVGSDDNSARIHYVKNNIAECIGNFAYSTYYNSRSDYNSTTSSTMGGTAGSNDRLSQTFSFVSSTNFALASNDGGALGYGLTDPGSGMFYDDITGTTREAPWDIGSFEFVSVGGLFAIRQFSNGRFQSTEFVESAGLYPALRIASNASVQLHEMIEESGRTTHQINTGGVYRCAEFIETN